MTSSPAPTIEQTISTFADVTITLEPGVEQTFPGALVEVMPPKPGRSDKVAVMVLAWVKPDDLLLWGAP